MYVVHQPTNNHLKYLTNILNAAMKIVSVWLRQNSYVVFWIFTPWVSVSFEDIHSLNFSVQIVV